MASLNQCSFIGQAGSDPKCRTFESGNKVANVNIAVSERYKDRSGQQQESTEWIPLVFNGALADIAEKCIRKGSQIFVIGKWRTRKYTDRDGAEHSTTEVVVTKLELLSKKEGASAPEPSDDLPE